MKNITKELWQISLGPVNAFIIDTGTEGLILVDCGFKNDHLKIEKALAENQWQLKDIRHIILTHSHPDHAGSAAELQKLTNAKVYMHHEDAALVKQGLAGRLPKLLSPGVLNFILFQLFIKNSPNAVDAFIPDVELNDNDELHIGKNIKVIHTPGHSKGHICLLLDNILIAGDICANMMTLGYSTVYENMAEGVSSILKSAELPFNIAVFGHGKPIMQQAPQRLKKRFS